MTFKEWWSSQDYTPSPGLIAVMKEGWKAGFTAGAQAQREADAKVAELHHHEVKGVSCACPDECGQDIVLNILDAPLCQPGDGHVVEGENPNAPSA